MSFSLNKGKEKAGYFVACVKMLTKISYWHQVTECYIIIIIFIIYFNTIKIQFSNFMIQFIWLNHDQKINKKKE